MTTKKAKGNTLGQWADAYAPGTPASEAVVEAPAPPATPDTPESRVELRRETYYLPVEIIESVRDASVHLGVPKGDVVETAVREWLRTQQIPQRTRRVRRGRPVT